MLGDQDMWCREENFIVFMYVLHAIDRDTMEWTTKFPLSKLCTRLLLYLSLAGFVCGLVYLIHRWPMLEKMRKTLSVAIGHFRITLGLFFKASPGAHPFI